MAETKITVSKNGPLRIQGEVEIVNAQGETIAKTNQAALCRCGHSNKKPMCDGSHNKAGFQAD